MKTIMLGWSRLKISEKSAMLLSIFVAISLSCLALTQGYHVISAQTIGPLILMGKVIQSTITTGIMWMRSIAMNHILVEALSELREVRANPGQHVPTKALDMVAEFLGDKE